MTKVIMDASNDAVAVAMEGSAATHEATHDTASTSHALVAFSYRNLFHDALRDATRWFPLAGTRIRIDQGWKPDGRGGTSIGFGASVYDAAVLLSLYLESHKDDIVDKRVLELGCGPGLVGIAAAHCGARSVMLTDGDPASVALTQHNIEANALASSVAHAREYLWGDAANALHHESAFDVIVGADIVACPYAGAFDALLASFRALAGPDTLLLLAYKLRHGSERGFFERFELEFDVLQVPVEELHPDFQQGDIALFRARRKPTV